MLPIPCDAGVQGHKFSPPFKGWRAIYKFKVVFHVFLILLGNATNHFVNANLSLLAFVHFKPSFFLGYSFGFSILFSCAVSSREFFNSQIVLFLKSFQQLFSLLFTMLFQLIIFLFPFCLLFLNLSGDLAKHFLIPLYLLIWIIATLLHQLWFFNEILIFLE